MQYDKNRFKILALPHPFILLWVLFPAIMFNELIFGQRLPKVTLIDKESDKPLEERRYIPCPHCETLNDPRLWATKENAFGHWFGLVCPSCHQIIPCVWNIFSLAVLAITFPLWYFPVRFFRHRWIEKEKERLAKVLERPLLEATSIHSMGWIGVFVLGVSLVVMFVTVEVVWNVWNGWDLKTMLERLPLWMSVGFTVICCLRWVEKETEKEKERLANFRGRPLIRPTFINWVSKGNLNLFLKGTFYYGGGMWVASEVWWVLMEGKEWDLRAMFDTLPFCLLAGFVMGCIMYVLMNLDLMNLKRRKP